MSAPGGFKIPESVLVVIHTPDLRVLLLQRADHAGFWQSVTGSRADPAEPLPQTCAREVAEETGLHAPLESFEDWRIRNEFEIFAGYRHRYAPGVTHNVEHVFGLRVDGEFTPVLSPREHTAWRWVSAREALDACFSWTNVNAVRRLLDRSGQPARND